MKNNKKKKPKQKLWTKEQILVDFLTMINILLIKSFIFIPQQGLFPDMS